jgi:hypothetical protein
VLCLPGRFATGSAKRALRVSLIGFPVLVPGVYVPGVHVPGVQQVKGTRNGDVIHL